MYFCDESFVTNFSLRKLQQNLQVDDRCIEQDDGKGNFFVEEE